MIPFLKRLLWDDAAFERYGKAILYGLATAMLSGAIEWPSWVSPKLITAMGAIAALIPTGQKNDSVEAEVKALREKVAKLTPP